jgi:hypothetical protein
MAEIPAAGPRRPSRRFQAFAGAYNAICGLFVIWLGW